MRDVAATATSDQNFCPELSCTVKGRNPYGPTEQARRATGMDRCKKSGGTRAYNGDVDYLHILCRKLKKQKAR